MLLPVVVVVNKRCRNSKGCIFLRNITKWNLLGKLWIKLWWKFLRKSSNEWFVCSYHKTVKVSENYPFKVCNTIELGFIILNSQARTSKKNVCYNRDSIQQWTKLTLYLVIWDQILNSFYREFVINVNIITEIVRCY